MTKRSKRQKAASAAHAGPDDQEESVGGIIEHIDGEAKDDGNGMMGLDAGFENIMSAVPSPAPEGCHEQGNRGAVPLLGLTSPNTDIVDLDGENMVPIEDSNFDTRRDPLLGTSTSQVLEISQGSSKKRSPESLCYDNLLRENAPLSGRKSRKIGRGEGLRFSLLPPSIFQDIFQSLHV